MKFVACINYADEQDSYDRYYFNQDIPFVADSLEEAKRIVNAAVEANTKIHEFNEEDYEIISLKDPEPIVTIFGHNFGEIQEKQHLSVEVMTLDDWFDKNQKSIDCQQ